MKNQVVMELFQFPCDMFPSFFQEFMFAIVKAIHYDLLTTDINSIRWEIA